jgi:hypothetical protein
LKNPEQILKEFESKQAKFFYYENLPSIDEQVSNLSQEDFDLSKEIAIKINVILRELLMNSSFMNFGNFFDINKYATEKFLSYWINNLIGFIVSKKIINEVAL